MPSAEIFLPFLLATFVFSYVPGPAMLYATAQTLARGRRAGLWAALGIHVGGYVHVLAAALGLSVLFETVPLLYKGVKLAGAAYLIFLGVRLFQAKALQVISLDTVPTKSLRMSFWESVTVEVLNPKTAVFFLAFLPQFIDPEAAFPIWVQFLILGVIVNWIFSSADILCVWLAGWLSAAMRRSQRAGRWAHRMAGGVIVGLGLHLALKP